jgi:hypothetical protein
MEDFGLRTPNEFNLRLLLLSLTAKGGVAYWLALPVALLVLAFAWRVALVEPIGLPEKHCPFLEINFRSRFTGRSSSPGGY